MNNSFIPQSICHSYHGGPLLTYVASDTELLRIVPASRLPKNRPGCRAKWTQGNDFIATYRMKDGRVRLVISERLVRQQDTQFQSFVSSLVAGKESANV